MQPVGSVAIFEPMPAFGKWEMKVVCGIAPADFPDKSP
jgi:hypothetical protein